MWERSEIGREGWRGKSFVEKNRGCGKKSVTEWIGDMRVKQIPLRRIGDMIKEKHLRIEIEASFAEKNWKWKRHGPLHNGRNFYFRGKWAKCCACCKVFDSLCKGPFKEKKSKKKGLLNLIFYIKDVFFFH